MGADQSVKDAVISLDVDTKNETIRGIVSYTVVSQPVELSLCVYAGSSSKWPSFGLTQQSSP